MLRNILSALLISYHITITFSIFWPGTALASEVDSFTGRRELSDSTDILNKKVHDWLVEVLDSTNLHTKQLARAKYHRTRSVSLSPRLKGIDYCNKDHLFRAMRQRFARPLIGQLESYVNQSSYLDTIKINFEESIYRDFVFEEAPTIASTGKMAVLVRINDAYIGADKFGHFFTEGLVYYNRAANSEHVLDVFAAIEFGELSESVFYGSVTTGVYSHADLAANFNGMRFWSRLLGDYDDPLFPNQRQEPYINCENKQWVIKQKFDWNEYVDIAWDEGVNCSQFRTRELLEKVITRIKQSGSENKKYCPIKTGNHDHLSAKYGFYLNHLFNNTGHKVLGNELQAENMVKKYLEIPDFNQLPEWQQKVINRAKTQINNLRQAYLISIKTAKTSISDRGSNES